MTWGSRKWCTSTYGGPKCSCVSVSTCGWWMKAALTHQARALHPINTRAPPMGITTIVLVATTGRAVCRRSELCCILTDHQSDFVILTDECKLSSYWD
jgi:hypothetical protein